MAGKVKDLFDWLVEEAHVIAGPGYKSELVRDFIIDFADQYQMDKIVEYAMYNTFIEQFPTIEMSRNYFHTICSRKWKCAADEKNITQIYITKERGKRRSKI